MVVARVVLEVHALLAVHVNRDLQEDLQGDRQEEPHALAESL